MNQLYSVSARMLQLWAIYNRVLSPMVIVIITDGGEGPRRFHQHDSSTQLWSPNKGQQNMVIFHFC
jgi:hypothetical protein